MTALLLLLLLPGVFSSVLRVETGHQSIAIEGRDVYMGYFTRVHFDALTCVGGLIVHCLQPLTGAEEIDLLYTACPKGHWRVAHYMNTKEDFRLKSEISAKQLLIASRQPLTIIDVQVIACVSNRKPNASCHDLRDHPHRHARPGTLRVHDAHVRRKRALTDPSEILDFEANSVVEFTSNKIVSRGSTMTVKRGSTLRFADGVSLIVYGSLVVKGTKTAPVRFEPSNRQWKGVNIVSGSPASSLAFLNISGVSGPGLTVTGGIMPNLENVVSDSNGIGFRIESNSSEVRVVKSVALNNRGAGFHFAGKASVVLDSCNAAANRGNGIHIQGSNKVRIRQTGIFSNGRTGVHAESVSDMNVDECSISGNGGGIRVTRLIKGKSKIELNRLNISGHHYGPAILLEDDIDTDLAIISCQIHDNYKGGFKASGRFESTIEVRNSSFTRNRGSTFDVKTFVKGSLNISGCAFHANQLNDFPGAEAVIRLFTETFNTNDVIGSIIDCQFTKNTMQEIVQIHKQGGKDINMIIEDSDFHGSLAHSVIAFDSPGILLQKNFLHNPQSSCEISTPSASLFDTSLNFWGYALQSEIRERVCTVKPNEVEIVSSSFSEDPVVFQQNPLPTFNNTYNLIPALPTPYTIDTDVLIRADTTVVVEPGTRFAFGPGVGITIQEKGKLILNGTENHPISMESNGPAAWRGLAAKPGGSLMISHATISDASVAVWLDSDRFYLDNTVIRKPWVHGVEVTANAGPVVDLGGTKIIDAIGTAVAIDERGDISLRDMVIENPVISGIDFVLPSGAVAIEDVVITNSGSHGIHISELQQAPLNTILIRNATLKNQKNGHAGILINGHYPSRIELERIHAEGNTVPSVMLSLECDEKPSMTRIVDSSFVDNKDTVVSLQLGECGGLEMERNMFDRNNADGRAGVVRVDAQPNSGMDTVPLGISNNDFSNNGGDFVVFLSTDGQHKINGSFSRNRVSDNTVSQAAVIVTSPSFGIHENRFENPKSQYQLEARTDGSWVVNATRNWWGSEDEAKAASSIKAQEGNVQFLPILTPDSLSSPNQGYVYASSTLPPAVVPVPNAASFDQCAHINHCSYRGSCIGSLCICPEGYTGADCSIQVGCPTNCSHNGICNAFKVCHCFEGWTSSDCSVPMCAFDCGGHGKCVSKNECECEEAWTGEFCLEPACSPTICKNGRCENKQCQCEGPWRGSRCEVPVCSACSLNGICVAPEKCQCFEDWGGEDCSTCVGPSCSACDLDCDHGSCDEVTRTCSCANGWSGAACDICERAGGCSTTGRISTIIPQTADRDDTNAVVTVFGQELPKTVNDHYSCVFGMHSTTGIRQSSSIIRCPVPGNLTNGRHLFNLAAGPNVLSTVDGKPVHFTVYDSCNPALCQGSCVGPLCLCPRGKTGVHCEAIEAVPEIDKRFLTNQKANTAVEGTPYVVYLPTMPGTVLKVNSSIPGLRLDSARNLLEWSDPVGNSRPHDITVTAHSRSGESALSWDVTVNPSYKAVIEDVSAKGNKLVFQGKAEGNQTNRVPISLQIRNTNGNGIEQVTSYTDNEGRFSYAYIPSDAGEYIVTATHPGEPEDEAKAFRVTAQPPPMVSAEGDNFVVQIPGEKQCSATVIPDAIAEVQLEETQTGSIARVTPKGNITNDLFLVPRCNDGKELIWITGPSSKVVSPSVAPSRLLFIQNVTSKLSNPVQLAFETNDKLLHAPIEIRSDRVLNIISASPKMDDFSLINAAGMKIILQMDVSTVGNGSISITSGDEDVLSIPYAVTPPNPQTVNGLIVTVCLKDEFSVTDKQEHIVASLSFTNLQYNYDQTQNNVVVNGQPALFRLKEGYYQVTASSPAYKLFTEFIHITSHNASFCITLTTSSSIIPALLDGNWTTSLISKPTGRLPFLEFHPSAITDSDQTDVLVTVKGDAPGVVSIVPTPEFKPKVQSVQTNDSFWATAKTNFNQAHCSATLMPVAFDYLGNGANSVVHSSSELIVSYKNSSLTFPTLCDESGTPVGFGTVTRLLCNCDEGAKASCRAKYRTATACGSAWSRIPDDTVSLQVLSTFLLLISECRDVGVELDELTSVLHCVSSLETDCPSVSTKTKRDVSNLTNDTDVPIPSSLEDVMMADGPASIINHISTVNGFPIGMQPQMQNIFNAIDMQSIRVASLYEEFFEALKKAFPVTTASRDDFDKFFASMGDRSELGMQISENELSGIQAQDLPLRWNDTVSVWNSGKMDQNKGVQFEDAQRLVAASDRLKSFARQNGATDPFVVLHEYIGRLLQTPSTPSQECAQAAVLIEPNVIYDGDTIKIRVLLTNTKDRPMTSPSLEFDIHRADTSTPQATLVASGIGVNPNNADGVLSPGESMETSWLKRIIPQKTLTTSGKYQPVITASFSVGGRPTKQRLVVPVIEIRPVRSAKVVHFVYPSVTDEAPFSVATSIMNIGYSTLKNVEVHTYDIVLKSGTNSEERVPYKVDGVEIDNKPNGNHLSFNVGTIPSGESKMIAINISTNAEHARIGSVHCPISVDGHIVAVQESSTYIVQAIAGHNGFMVTDGTGAMFFFRPETGTLVNVVPLVYVASQKVDMSDPIRKVVVASFRNEESRSFTGFLWGAVPLSSEEVPKEMELVRVVEKGNGKRDRQVRPITWINKTPGGTYFNFIDNGFASPSYQLTYEYTFADPSLFSVPYFDQSSYRIQLIPDAWWPTPPATVGQITAESFDGAQITYSLFSPDNIHRFSVDEDSGSIIMEEHIEQGREFCLILVARDDRGQESRVPIAINAGGQRQDCLLFNTEGLTPLVSHHAVLPTILPTSSGMFTVSTLPTEEPPTDRPAVSTTDAEIDIPTPPTFEPTTEDGRITGETTVIVTTTNSNSRETTPDGGSSQESTTEGQVESTTETDDSTTVTESHIFTVTIPTQGGADTTTETTWTEVHTPDHTLPTIVTEGTITPDPSPLPVTTDDPTAQTDNMVSPTSRVQSTTEEPIDFTRTSTEGATEATTEHIYSVTPDHTPATITFVTPPPFEFTTEPVSATTDKEHISVITHNPDDSSTQKGTGSTQGEPGSTEPTITEEPTTEFIYTMSSEAGLHTVNSSVWTTTETIHSVSPDFTLPVVETTTEDILGTSTEFGSTNPPEEETTLTLATRSPPTLTPFVPTSSPDIYKDACKKTSVPLWNLICELSKTVARRGGG